MNSLVVLTRPGDKNDPLARRLNEAVFGTLALPALTVRPLQYEPNQVPLPGDYDLIVFVSGNAARFYLERLQERGSGVPWPAHTWAATVGPASAQPLYNSDFVASSHILHPELTDPSQDSEALWRLLQPLAHQFKRVLIVRGETGRDWLGQQLERLGANVRRFAVYRREPARWSDAQRQLLEAALESRRRIVCLLTSAESVDAIHGNTNAAGLNSLWEQARFVVIHERIAQRLQSLSAATSGKVYRPVVKICAPTEDAIFQTIVSTASL